MVNNSILVTGGAGYIGSHVVRQLRERNESVLVLDDLSSGFREAIGDTLLVIGNIDDGKGVTRLLHQHGIATVMHFAARSSAPESVGDPLGYYRNNTCGTRTLLECCVAAGVDQMVFSSTAAVYGIPTQAIVDEDTSTRPINPYGRSKLMGEWMLRDLDHVCAMRHVILRYCNVAGSDPRGRIGQSTRAATSLFKVAAEVATGKRDALRIFGTDYPTPDGTGVRDYIHVEDLANAHLSALDYLRSGAESTTLNCGYGHGNSVREVVGAIERANGSPISVIEEPRRAGDPPCLIADSRRAQHVLGWTPRHDNLDEIARTALAWERSPHY